MLATATPNFVKKNFAFSQSYRKNSTGTFFLGQSVDAKKIYIAFSTFAVYLVHMYKLMLRYLELNTVAISIYTELAQLPWPSGMTDLTRS